MELINKLNFVFDKKFKKKIILILSIILTTTLLEILGISLVIPIFALIFDDDKLNKYFIFKDFFQNGSKNNIIIVVTAAVIIIYFIKNILLSLFEIYESKFICSN